MQLLAELLSVKCFSDPTFDTAMIDTLVMKDERRRLIKALAKNYQSEPDSSSQRTPKPWAADFVAGKGDGKIFLLHGKPGVGKTYTAGESCRNAPIATLRCTERTRMHRCIYQASALLLGHKRYRHSASGGGKKPQSLFHAREAVERHPPH